MRSERPYEQYRVCHADLICDALPLEVWQTHTVTDVILYYHKEVPMGESTRLYRAAVDENRWYMAGWQGDTCNFEAEITLAPLQDNAD